MQIYIDLRSKVPLYEQIVLQIKHQILSGILKDGASLPSMRSLAKTHNISVISVQKSYEQLQREGFIDSMVGRGTYARIPDIHQLRAEYMTSIKEHANQMVMLAKGSGVTFDDLVSVIKEQYH